MKWEWREWLTSTEVLPPIKFVNIELMFEKHRVPLILVCKVAFTVLVGMICK
jgi:hypothetical protein